MKIYHTRRTLSTVTATTEATGYEATNVDEREILKPWRSTSGAANTVTITLSGGVAAVSGLWVQQANFALATVEYSTDGAAWNNVGTLTMQTEHNGRTKGHIESIPNASHLRIIIGSGSPSEGYWTIGAVYVFSAVYSMPKAPRYGFTRQIQHPNTSRTLPNGRTVAASTGPIFSRINANFTHRPTENVAEMIRLARLGIVGVDLEVAATPENAWPMEYVESGYDSQIASVSTDETAATLAEVV